jgi:hypothetical protein
LHDAATAEVESGEEARICRAFKTNKKEKRVPSLRFGMYKNKTAQVSPGGSGLSCLLVYLRRVINPPSKEPKPNSPNKGSGEAVCGRAAPLLPAEAGAAFWSLLALVEALAFWSAVLVLGVAATPAEELAGWAAVAFWSTALVVEGVVEEAALEAAGAEEVLVEVEAELESKELLEGVVLVAGAAAVVDAVELFALCEAVWSAELIGAEPVLVGPVEGVELAVPVAGALPVVELAGAEAALLLAADWDDISVELGVLEALEAGAAGALLLEAGAEADAELVSVDEVIAEPELAVEGWLEVEELELEAVLLQPSEIIFTESTFKELMSVESGAPVTWSVCPTCALKSWVFPVSFQFLPELSTNV